MKIYQATHWTDDDPKMTHEVLIGVMPEDEFDRLNEAESHGEEDKFISELTNGEYTDADFTHYFEDTPYAFRVGNTIDDYGDLYKIEKQLSETKQDAKKQNTQAKLLANLIRGWVAKNYGTQEAEDPSWNIESLAETIAKGEL